MNEMLDAALGYARRGWAVLPLNYIIDGACSCGKIDCSPKSRGKHPLYELVPNGHLNASADLDTVRRWWQAHPNANIAKRVESDEIVIDVESLEKTGVDGVARFEDLRGSDKLGALPPTFTVKTATGGYHYHFKRPASLKGALIKKWLINDAIELKYQGYVVMPPSVTGMGIYEVVHDV